MVRWPRDLGLDVRMVVTMVLLMVIYFVFLSVLAYLGVETIIVMGIMVLMLLLQYFFSDRMVLWSMGAKEVSEQAAPRLHETVTRLCAIAGIPRPRIAVVNSNVPNAFATGRNPRNSVVAVTTSLVSTLSQGELEAVIAHELGHFAFRLTDLNNNLSVRPYRRVAAGTWDMMDRGCFNAPESSPFGAVYADQAVIVAFISQEHQPGGRQNHARAADFGFGGPALVVDAGDIRGIRVERVDHVRPGDVIAVLKAVGVGITENESIHEIQGVAHQPFQRIRNHADDHIGNAVVVHIAQGREAGSHALLPKC